VSRYYGNIGFAVQEETRPGIWEDTIEEKSYKGDILHSGRRYENSENINDDVVLTNRFSIISDAYLTSHIPSLRYLTYMGSKFKITSVELERPRVIISVGGIYVSGESEDSSSGGSGEHTGD
jgi:hypothetical protein